MFTRLFPLMVAAVLVTALAPVAVGFVGGLTTDLANETAATLESLK